MSLCSLRSRSTPIHRVPLTSGIRHSLVGRLVVLFGVLVALTLPTKLAAQSNSESDPDGRMESMLERATEAYDTLKIKQAQTLLDDAVSFAADHDVSPSLHARAHVLQGVVDYAQSRNEQSARDNFVRALEIDGNASVPDVYRTPTLARLMDEARERADRSDAASDESSNRDPSPTPTKKPPPESLQHTPVTTANAGNPVDLKVRIPNDLSASSVVVFVRRFNQEDFWQLQMETSNATTWRATIPGERVYTSQLDYFIEVRDGEENVVARSGSANSPHSVTVLGSADYNPKASAESTDDASTDAGPTGPEGPPKKRQPSEALGPTRHLYIQPMFGSAGSFLVGGDPTANPGRSVQPGFAPAFAHTRLDIGTMITDRTHLGIFVRWQFSPEQSVQGLEHLDRSGFPTTEAECLGTGISGDCQIGLMLRHFLSSSPNLEAFVSGGLGVGRTREWLRLKEPASTDFCEGRRTFNSGGESFCYRRDTVRPGWFHVGGGGGLNWPLTDQFSLVAESYLQILLPAPAIHIDVQVGPRIEF